jgi:hypothetical protein
MAELNNENLTPDQQLAIRGQVNRPMVPLTEESPEERRGREAVEQREQREREQRENLNGGAEEKKAGRDLSQSRGQADQQKKPASQKIAQEAIGFSYTIWYAAIILAVSYDILGMCAGETASWFDWIIDIFLGGGLSILLWTQGAKKNQTKKIVQWIITTFGEVIPGIGILPLYTIVVLYQFYMAKQDQEASQLQASLEQKTQIQTQTAK